MGPPMLNLDLAYIDPGTGSLIVQVLIATLIAIPVFFRSQIARVMNLAKGGRKDPAPVDDVVDAD